MRLWSLHPSLLDRPGLIALWREALLAQAVLAARTRGYRHHPQLLRFQECPDPRGALAAYLDGVRAEASTRGYRFDAGRVGPVPRWEGCIDVGAGQLAYELSHLRRKVATRSPERLATLPSEAIPHPLFRVIEGGVAVWERPEA